MIEIEYKIPPMPPRSPEQEAYLRRSRDAWIRWQKENPGLLYSEFLNWWKPRSKMFIVDADKRRD